MLPKTLLCLSTKLPPLFVGTPISTLLSWSVDVIFQLSFLKKKKKKRLKNILKSDFFFLIYVKYPKKHRC